MSDLELKPEIQSRIENIAKSYGFTKINFDTQFPFEGFRNNLASTGRSNEIIYRFLFLNPATQFYSIDKTLFEKATKVLTLHEKTHHDPPFNSDPYVDDYLVQQQACKEWGNQKEMMFLDILTCEYSRVKHLSESQIEDEVNKHIKKYVWIDDKLKSEVGQILFQKENYKERNLKRILSRYLAKINAIIINITVSAIKLRAFISYTFP